MCLCYAVVVRWMLPGFSQWSLRRLLVSTADLPRPAGRVCRVAGPLTGHEEPHRRAKVSWIPGLGALPSPHRLLSAGTRLHRTKAPTVLRRPSPTTSVLSHRVT